MQNVFGEIAAVLHGEAPAGPAGPALLRWLLRADTRRYFSRGLRPRTPAVFVLLELRDQKQGLILCFPINHEVND